MHFLLERREATLLGEPAADFGVGDGGFAHVVIHFVVDGGFEDVCFGFGVVAEGFEVEAEVKVGVAEVVAAEGGVVAFASGGEDGVDGAGAGEEIVDLFHGDAGVAFDWDEGFAGGFDAVEAGNAEEVPGGVFDVVGVGGLMDFELVAAVLEAFGIVEGEAALPELGFGLGDGFDDFVEGDGGVFNSGIEERIDAGLHPLVGSFSGLLGGGGDEASEEEGGGEAKHGSGGKHDCWKSSMKKFCEFCQLSQCCAPFLYLSAPYAFSN